MRAKEIPSLENSILAIYRKMGALSIGDYAREATKMEGKTISPIAALMSIQRLMISNKLPSNAYTPTELPKPLEDLEVQAIRDVIQEAQEKEQRLTFEEIAERALKKSGSQRPLDAMIQKIRFLFISVRFDDESDFSSDEDEDGPG